MLFELARFIIWSAKGSYGAVVNRKRHIENAKGLLLLALRGLVYVCVAAAALNALTGGGIIK